MPDLERKVGSKLSRRSLLTASFGLATIIASGCQSTQKLEVTQSGAPSFDQFRAEYRFEQADHLLNRSFAKVDIRELTSTERSELRTVSAATSWSHAKLQIECPHLSGDSSLALLTLTLSDRRGPATLVHKKAMQLTIERSDIELLISDLANNGYFDELSGDYGNAQLKVQIDRGRLDRTWIDDARLLDLARRTLLNGTPATR